MTTQDVQTTSIFIEASNGIFSGVSHWLQRIPDAARKTDTKGWTLLHHLAKAEAEKRITPAEIKTLTTELFAAGANVHQDAFPAAGHAVGDTAFNIAAPASPIVGRLMTNHWLAQALEGKGTKGLNDRSGSHHSTLAQYMAKWSNADEIDKQLDEARAKGMNIATQNASGWTPLHAAAAMVGRLHAVKAFAARYSEAEKKLLTRESYRTSYSESPEPITYAEHLTADGIAKARLAQATTLPEASKKELAAYVSAIQFYKGSVTPLSPSSFAGRYEAEALRGAGMRNAGGR